MLMNYKFRPTKAHIIYGEILKRPDLIQTDVYRVFPISRETLIKIDDISIIMYRVDEWLDFPIIFFSDENFKLIEDRKFIKMVEKYVRIK